MRRVVLLAGVLAACGGAPDPAPTTPSTGVAVVELDTSSNPRPAPLPAHTLWSGRYDCAQGVTALTLTLDLDGSGRASAVFDFGPTPENPTVPNGRYLLAGPVDPGPDGTRVTLVPDRWIAQPPGYMMVGLTLTIHPSGRSMVGRVEHPSCTVAALDRVQ